MRTPEEISAALSNELSRVHLIRPAINLAMQVDPYIQESFSAGEAKGRIAGLREALRVWEHLLDDNRHGFFGSLMRGRIEILLENEMEGK